MNVVPSLSSLTALLLLLGRVDTQGKCFLMVCVDKEQGAAEMQEKVKPKKMQEVGWEW